MSTSTNPAPTVAHFVGDAVLDQKIDAVASGFVNVERGALATKRKLAAQIEEILADRPEDESSAAFAFYREKFTYVRETYEARYQWHYIDQYKAEPGQNAFNQAWSRLLAYTSIKPINKAGRPRKATESAEQATESAEQATEQATEQAPTVQTMTAKGAAELLRSAISALLTKKGKKAKQAEADGGMLITLATHWDAAISGAKTAAEKAEQAERDAAEQAERDAKQAELQSLAAQIAAEQIAALQAKIDELQRSKGRAKK